MKEYKKLFQEKKIELPDIGEEILTGKFKNRKEIIKNYSIDENNQPIIITNKGERKLFSFRIIK